MAQIKMLDAEVTSLVDGQIVKAKVFLCPECGEGFGPPLFTIFQIDGHDHVHLQCGYCDETYCTAEQCKPPEKKIIVVPG